MRTKRSLRDSWLVALFLDLAWKLPVGFAILFPLSVSIRTGLIGQLAVDGTLACCLLGSFVIQIWTRPGWREILGALACGVMLGLVYARFWDSPNLSVAVTCASFLGVGSLTFLAIRTCQATGEQRRRKWFTLGAASVLPFAWIVEGLALSRTVTLYPKTFDQYLYAFDSNLGFQPGFAIAKLFADRLALQRICMFIYEALPLEVSFLYAWRRLNPHRLPVNVLMLFVTANVAGFLLYSICPAAGPVHVFDKAAPRNAMPSVHVTMALLVFWNSIAWPGWARAITGLFLILTILATLGFGEHYLIDLVVAVPFSLSLQATWTIGPERRTAFIAGALFTLAWLMLLRIGTPLLLTSPAIASGAIAATIVPCWLLQRRLQSWCTLQNAWIADSSS